MNNLEKTKIFNLYYKLRGKFHTKLSKTMHKCLYFGFIHLETWTNFEKSRDNGLDKGADEQQSDPIRIPLFPLKYRTLKTREL